MTRRTVSYEVSHDDGRTWHPTIIMPSSWVAAHLRNHPVYVDDFGVHYRKTPR